MSERYGLEQVSVRMVKEAPLLSNEKINTPEDAVRILADAFRDYDREVVGVVHLRSCLFRPKCTVIPANWIPPFRS